MQQLLGLAPSLCSQLLVHILRYHHGRSRLPNFQSARETLAPHPASDRTFWGCFCFWRKPMPPSNIEQGEGEKRNSSVGADPNSAAVRSPLQVSGPFQLPRLAQFRLSKSSDQQKAAADMAYERLRIEQEERRKANQANESTTIEQGVGTLECRD
jgi:hypothetical protein